MEGRDGKGKGDGTANFRFQISDFRYQISDIRFQISVVSKNQDA